MGFPEYITAWTQVENEKLETRMEPEKKRIQICSCCHWREPICCWSYNERQNWKIYKNNFLLLASESIS